MTESEQRYRQRLMNFTYGAIGRIPAKKNLNLQKNVNNAVKKQGRSRGR